MNTQELLTLIVETLKNKKATEIVSINVEHLTIVAEHFVLCSGTSATTVKALAESLDEAASKAGVPPRRTEGKKEGRWVAMDFGSIIVHIFHAETRRHYMIEKLWDDGGNIIEY